MIDRKERRYRIRLLVYTSLYFATLLVCKLFLIPNYFGQQYPANPFGVVEIFGLLWICATIGMGVYLGVSSLVNQKSWTLLVVPFSVVLAYIVSTVTLKAFISKTTWEDSINFNGLYAIVDGAWNVLIWVLISCALGSFYGFGRLTRRRLVSILAFTLLSCTALSVLLMSLLYLRS